MLLMWMKHDIINAFKHWKSISSSTVFSIIKSVQPLYSFAQKRQKWHFDIKTPIFSVIVGGFYSKKNEKNVCWLKLKLKKSHFTSLKKTVKSLIIYKQKQTIFNYNNHGTLIHTHMLQHDVVLQTK